MFIPFPGHLGREQFLGTVGKLYKMNATDDYLISVCYYYYNKLLKPLDVRNFFEVSVFFTIQVRYFIDARMTEKKQHAIIAKYINIIDLKYVI